MDILQRELEYLLNLSPPVLLGVLLIGFGRILKASPMNNFWITPILVLAGGIAYPIIVDATKLEYEASVRPICWAVLHGLAIGFASTGAYELVRHGARLVGDLKKKETDTKLFTKKKK